MAGEGAPFDGRQTMRELTVAPRPGWYRGVRLQRPVSQPRMPLHLLQAAVDNAIRRNLTKLARDGMDW